MDGLGANNARYMLLSNPDRFAHQLAHIDSAHGIKTEDTFPFIVGQHQPDFIHMRREHHPQPFFPLVCLRAGMYRQHVPQGIYLDIFDQRAHLFQHNRTDFAFIARNGTGVAQPL